MKLPKIGPHQIDNVRRSFKKAQTSTTNLYEYYLTEMAKKVCPRLCEIAPRPEAGSRNLGPTFLANSVYEWYYSHLVDWRAGDP